MATAEAKVVPRLKERYEREIKPALIERFGYSSPMQAPRLVKITVNMGVGDATRVGVRREDGRRIRVARRTGNTID